MMECIFGPMMDDMSMTTTPPVTLPTGDALEALTTGLTGRLLLFGDADYEVARLGTAWTPAICQPGVPRANFGPATHPTETWNTAACEYPAAIAVVQGVSDVEKCVRFCAATKTSLAVAGGRHSHKCMVQDALVVDLSAMRKCDMIKRPDGAMYLVCEGGALNGDAWVAMDGTGYVVNFGHHPGTGIGGLVQQGGHGLLEKVHGMSVDALVGATVVTADFRAKRCSATENADLFWAIRGGCGNFGVVTSFEFKARRFPNQKMATLQRVHLPLPLSLTPSRLEVLVRFRDVCNTLPAAVQPLIVVTSFELIELYYFVGDDAVFEQDGAEALEKYRTGGRPVVDKVEHRDFFKEVCWDALGPDAASALPAAYYPASSLLGALTDEACAILAVAAKAMPNAGCQILVNQLGGAAASVADDSTAVGYRKADHWIIILATWKETMTSTAAQERDKAVKWARELRQDLLPFSVGRYAALAPEDHDKAAANHDTAASEDPLNGAAWGPNYARLRDLKRKFDPKNLFHNNMNIIPAEPKSSSRLSQRANNFFARNS